MERIMIDVGHGPFPLDVMIGADIPHRRLRAAHQNEKQPSGDLGLGQVFLGDIMLALPDRTIDDRNAMGSGVAAGGG